MLNNYEKTIMSWKKKGMWVAYMELCKHHAFFGIGLSFQADNAVDSNKSFAALDKAEKNKFKNAFLTRLNELFETKYEMKHINNWINPNIAVATPQKALSIIQDDLVKYLFNDDKVGAALLSVLLDKGDVVVKGSKK